MAKKEKEIKEQKVEKKLPKISLKGLRESIRKEFGGEAVCSFNELLEIPRESTDLLLLDDLLGRSPNGEMGLPMGRIMQIYGPESSGKSSLVQYIAGKFYKRGLPIGYIDTENTIEPKRAKDVFGFDVFDEDLVLFSQNDNAAQVYEMIYQMVEKGVKLIIIDTMDGLQTEAQEEANFGQAEMAQMARANSQGLRKLKRIMNTHKALMIMVSQTREKIGVTHGETETTSGGKSILYYSSIRLRVSKTGPYLGDKDSPTGQTMTVKSRKNKTFVPFLSCELTLDFKKGFDGFNDVIKKATDLTKDGIAFIIRGGAWPIIYKPDGSIMLHDDGTEMKFQGKDALIEFLKSNEAVYEYVKSSVIENMGKTIESRIEPEEVDPAEEIEPKE